MTTFDDLVRERDQFRTEATNLLTRAGDADLSGEDAARFDQLTAEIEDRNGKIREMEDRNRRAADLLRAVRDPNGRVRLEGEADRVSPYGRDEDSPPVVRQRDDAMRTLDRATKAGKLEARGAELVENLMRPALRRRRAGRRGMPSPRGPRRTSGRSPSWSPIPLRDTSNGRPTRATPTGRWPRFRPSSAR